MPDKFAGSPMTDVRGFLKVNEIDRMIELAEEERDKLLLETLWMTGARISEVVGLAKIDSMDGQDHRDWGLKPEMLIPADNVIVLITLKRTKPDGDGRAYIAPERWVVVPARLIAGLVDYVKRHNIENGARIFPITRRWAWVIIKRVAEKAQVRPPGRERPDGKVKHVHPHLFRHSHGVNFVQHDDSIEGVTKLQHRLGHKDPLITMGYLKYSTRKTQAEIEEMF